MNIEAHDKIADNLRRIVRTCEMSAGIMRDPARTGGWAGAEKTSDQFERIGERAKDSLALLLAEPR